MGFIKAKGGLKKPNEPGKELPAATLEHTTHNTRTARSFSPLLRQPLAEDSMKKGPTEEVPLPIIELVENAAEANQVNPVSNAVSELDRYYYEFRYQSSNYSPLELSSKEYVELGFRISDRAKRFFEFANDETELSERIRLAKQLMDIFANYRRFGLSAPFEKIPFLDMKPMDVADALHFFADEVNRISPTKLHSYSFEMVNRDIKYSTEMSYFAKTREKRAAGVHTGLGSAIRYENIYEKRYCYPESYRAEPAYIRLRNMDAMSSTEEFLNTITATAAILTILYLGWLCRNA